MTTSNQSSSRLIDCLLKVQHDIYENVRAQSNLPQPLTRSLIISIKFERVSTKIKIVFILICCPEEYLASVQTACIESRSIPTPSFPVQISCESFRIANLR